MAALEAAPAPTPVGRRLSLAAAGGPAPDSFAGFLRRYRTRAGLSQNALAKVVALNASYINRLETGERGEPTREVVHALARALALSPDEVDRLHFAAGYVPPRLHKLGPADSTIAAVARLLTNDRLSPECRADFRACVETMAIRWQTSLREVVPASQPSAERDLANARAELARLKARLARLARDGGAA